MDQEELQLSQMKKINSGAINSSSVRLMEIADRIRDRELGGRQFSRLKVDQTGNINYKPSRKIFKENWTKEDHDFIEDESDFKNNSFLHNEFFCFMGDVNIVNEQLQNMAQSKMKADKKKPSSKKNVKRDIKKQKKGTSLKKRKFNNASDKILKQKKLKRVAKKEDLVHNIFSSKPSK